MIIIEIIDTEGFSNDIIVKMSTPFLLEAILK